jgi:hypothetical protein
LDFTVAPAGVLFCDTDNQVFKVFVDRWSSTFVFMWVGPFPTDQIPMPAKDRLRLEDLDDISELMGGSARNLFELGGKDRQSHFFQRDRV